jgi:ribonuclease P/MRP protein subunit RPP1
MKRVFADLHLRLSGSDVSQAKILINKASRLGYKLIAIPLSPTVKLSEVSELKQLCIESGLDFATRINLRPNNQNDLLTQLRKFRRKFEIICVLCENKEVARQAAKDRRVDLLNFPFPDYRRRFFDHAEAELACGACASLEVDMKPLLVLEGPARVRFLSSLRRETAIAKEFHLPLVISSGVSEPLLLRRPREMALLSSLFGVIGDAALDAVSTTPAGVVACNREKLSEGFMAPGIRVIKQGEAVEKT